MLQPLTQFLHLTCEAVASFYTRGFTRDSSLLKREAAVADKDLSPGGCRGGSMERDRGHLGVKAEYGEGE